MQVILSTYFSTTDFVQFILCDWFYAKIIIWPFSSKGYLSGVNRSLLCSMVTKIKPWEQQRVLNSAQEHQRFCDERMLEPENLNERQHQSLQKNIFKAQLLIAWATGEDKVQLILSRSD